MPSNSHFCRLLILVCIVTPLNLAFSPDEEPTLERTVWETAVDFSFMIDMIVIFNSAYYDD